MDDREEKIRVRAYEIWERQGRTGAPRITSWKPSGS
jgi:hypothetical protein